ncbi:MAG: EthD family reductase, partial [Candidatus Promineifilaceae bacterium]
EIMIKVISLMKRKEGMSIEEFRRWVFEEHSQLGAQFPKIRHYRVSAALPDYAEGPYDTANELYFDTYEDFIAALQSDIGAQAGADIKAHCAEDRFRLVTDEKIIVD